MRRSLAAFAFAFLGFAATQGCSSEETAESNTAGTCPGTAAYCPAGNGAGKACCLQDKCGIDNGMGCIANTADAG